MSLEIFQFFLTILTVQIKVTTGNSNLKINIAKKSIFQAAKPLSYCIKIQCKIVYFL